MSLKKSAFFIAISAFIAVNLAIQIARFSSYTSFMKNLKLSLAITHVEKAATSVKATFSFNLQTKEKNVRAYVSGIQLLLKTKDTDLGYHLIVGDQANLGNFENGKFHYVCDVTFLSDQTSNLLNALKKQKTQIEYTAYVETHVTQGTHDLRSVPEFTGNINVKKGDLK